MNDLPKPTIALKLPALKVTQRIGDFFTTSILAADLVAISHFDVRRLADQERDFERYMGIQRPVSKKRVSEIRKYLRGGDATFPTAVIVAVDHRCAEYDSEENTLTLYQFRSESDDEKSIPFERIARVIDGQHRIAAFLDPDFDFDLSGSRKLQDEFFFNLTVFIGADVAEQASIFATVNLSQTKVNRSLVYDLTELAKTPSPQKTCHNVAVMLDGERTSPFYERIKRLGVATPGRKREPLTQAAFVESLLPFLTKDEDEDRIQMLKGKIPKTISGSNLRSIPFRNLFLNNKNADIAEIIYNYFSAVRERWPNSWENLGMTSNLLPKSNAFKALMKFLRTDLYLEVTGEEIGRVPSTSEFQSFFENLDIEDSDFTTKNFVPGSGGQSMFYKLLRGEVTREDLIEDSDE